MIAVTVEFNVHPPYVEVFDAAMLRQARNSLDREPDCHRFDVCRDPQVPERTFLYEVYTDQAAFDAHLTSEHFQQFDAEVKDWIASKKVAIWSIVDNE